MRHTILIITLFLSGSFWAYGQVTIDLSNFPRQASYLDTFVTANTNGNTAPAHGAAQIWDYSSLTQKALLTDQHYAQVNNPDFPNATSSFNQDLSFREFVIPSDSYEGLDANGLFDVGAEIFGIKYPISTITGGANDTLAFPPLKIVFGNRFDFVQFPCTYQKKWTTTTKENIDFELTVATYGLNKAPGSQSRTLTQTREVVGYGQLIMPTLDGSPSSPMDVLLIREDRAQSDSFFLGGAPAPAALLGAFGITQNLVARDSSYVFYRPGFGSPLLRVGMPYDSDPISFSYRPQGAQITTGISEALQLEAISISPNPVAKGQKVQFQADLPAGQGSIQLYDNQGRIVDKMNIQTIGQGHYESTLPASLPSGTYFYFVQDQHGAQKGMGKLLVQ